MTASAPGRGLSAPNAAAAGERVARPVAFARLAFDSETLALTNAPFDVTWGGTTYVGVGHFGGIEAVEEGVELQAYRVRLTLNGIPTALVSVALGQHYQGRQANLSLGFLDDGHRLLDDPFTLFRGRMDTMTIALGETASIVLTVESRLADWERPRVRRYNNADQQQRHPGDRFFEFAEQTAERNIVWPAGSFFDRAAHS